MPYCPHCRKANAEGSLLCSNCGQSLTTNEPLPAAQAGGVAAVNPSLSVPVNSTFSPPMPAAGATLLSGQLMQEGAPYKTSGRFEVTSIPLLLMGIVLAGLIMGVLYGLITNFFSIVFIFPAAGGLCAGGLVYKFNSLAKNRNVPLAAIAGLLAGFFTMGTAEFSHAWVARPAMVQDISDSILTEVVQKATGNPNADLTAIPPAELTKLQGLARKVAEKELTPWTTLVYFEQASAAVGTTIKHNGAGSGVTVAGNWFWLLSAVELIIMMVCAAIVGLSSAQRPFCESCSAWHKETQVLRAHPMQNRLILDKIRARDWTGLLEIPAGATIDSKNASTVSVTKCAGCGQGTVSVVSTTPVYFVRQNLSPESTRSLVNLQS